MQNSHLLEIISGTIGPYDCYCDGSQRQNYLCAITLSCSKVLKEFYHKGSKTLDEINAFDSAEVEGVYIGQINMITATSFCGPMGAIWGYDLVKSEALRNEKYLEVKDRDGKEISVYSAIPLIRAAESLFGTKEEKHFPLVPGAVVRCANKNIQTEVPQHIYCAIGIGIPADREKEAVLWMEDVGSLGEYSVVEDKYVFLKEKIYGLLAESIVGIGRNHNVEFKEIFVHMEEIEVSKGEIGCALVAVPYFLLAKKALPEKEPGRLINMTLSDWERNVDIHFLNRRSKDGLQKCKQRMITENNKE